MIVFVHGVPETAEVWDRVRERLTLPSIALSLPGFGCARPDGFGATKDDYVAWVLEQLNAIDEPVDLVGHDWGALITYRIVTRYGDRVRSWVADVGNGAHHDVGWHRFAKVWQTPGEGEEYFRTVLATPIDAIAPLYESFGLNAHDATLVASWCDETMASCILDLYRSAVPNIASDWGDDFAPTSAPGMILHASDDAFSNEEMSEQVATRLAARHVTVDGVGPWWMLQEPRGPAALIEGFVREHA